MKYAASATFAAALVGLAVAQSPVPTVTTPPSLVECQPAQFTVSGGTAPYFLSVLPGGQVGSAPLETLPTVDAPGTVTWEVDIPSGTSITIQVRDSTGSLNYSQQVTIQPGSSTSCIGANSSLGGSTATQGSTRSGGASSTASGGPSSVSRASSSASSQASSAQSSSAAASSSRAQSSSAPASSSGQTTTQAGQSSTSQSSAPSASASNSAANGLFAKSGFLGAVAAVVMAVVA